MIRPKEKFPINLRFFFCKRGWGLENWKFEIEFKTGAGFAQGNNLLHQKPSLTLEITSVT